MFRFRFGSGETTHQRTLQRRFLPEYVTEETRIYLHNSIGHVPLEDNMIIAAKEGDLSDSQVRGCRCQEVNIIL